MKFSRQFTAILLVISLSLLVGCDNSSSESISDEKNPNKKISVIASLFPHYDFTKIIAGEFADVTLILPPGVESHAYEPTPKDIITITEADIFLYTNEAMEPWAKSIIENVDSQKTQIIDLSNGIVLLASSHEHEEEHAAESEEEHMEGEYDPHYWLDPNNAIIMVDTIKNALIKEMPENEVVFNENADKLKADLRALDQAFVTTFEKTDSKTILSGGHFAFGYLAARYGLENLSPYVGFSPDAEPTPQRIAALIDNIETTKAKAIFYEELIDPRVAKIISEESGVEMLLLHGAHNISKEEIENGTTYLEIMKGNLERLKRGLGYHE